MEARLSLLAVITLSFLAIFPPCYCDGNDQQFLECSRPYNCGSLNNIHFPFWGDDRPQYCGHQVLKLSCHDNKYPVMEFEELKFRVLNISQLSHRMTIARLDLWDSLCPEAFLNTTLDFSVFYYPSTVENLTLFYGCPVQLNDTPFSNRFMCGSEVNAYVLDDAPPSSILPYLKENCSLQIKVPILRSSNQSPIEYPPILPKALNDGFEVEYNDGLPLVCKACVESGGACGFNSSTQKFVCFCPDQLAQDYICKRPAGRLNWKKLALAIALSTGMGVLMVMIWCFRKKLSSNRTIHLWKQESLSNITVETFLRNNGCLALRRYSYSDIKKMTNFFTDKLGQGGYGGVYKGKLPDGSLVAVKVLKECKGNGEEFINEVASISRTSHVNIVTLMGFCFEGSKRGLIYEFMPHGSLDKFIYKQNLSLRDGQRLEWEVLQNIAVGIARGLEYLHKGCNTTRILHFDIKPHNILLDENFCPKISDFGLAKICPREESIISMLGARGTIGYIAPEVFSRNFGEVSHKSDVYSYGMMVSEMVGGRKNTDAEADRTSEIFFPYWIYKRLEINEELRHLGLMNEKDRESARRMAIVSLWCIQTDPLSRPSMSKVVEMLEGTLESLQIPPKPLLYSPSRSPIDPSTTVRSLQNDDHVLSLVIGSEP